MFVLLCSCAVFFHIILESLLLIWTFSAILAQNFFQPLGLFWFVSNDIAQKYTVFIFSVQKMKGNIFGLVFLTHKYFSHYLIVAYIWVDVCLSLFVVL